jgi:hypothetical protein
MRIAAIVLLCMAAAAALDDVFSADPDHPAIGYSTRPLTDPVAALNSRLDEDKVHLRFEDESGYLRSVLDALGIPVESQLVVFSKTSLQKPLISPTNPRTIFFNDTVSVAWVRGEPFVEAASQDPRQGMIFYTLDQRESEAPQFKRRIEPCVSCHVSFGTLGVPGMVAKSVFARPDGGPIFEAGSTDHRTPVERRWGGWHVTGAQGIARHMGDAAAPDADNPETLAPAAVFIDARVYLSQESDAAALAVFDHQMRMMNLLTRAGWDARIAPELAAAMAREVVDYMLFANEAPLGIKSKSAFARSFESRGQRDSKNRSLRDLDLNRRLLRYPCSYMIYAPVFDALPDISRAAIYAGLWKVLSGEEPSRLTLADRTAIVEILQETKPGLPDYFQVKNVSP